MKTFLKINGGVAQELDKCKGIHVVIKKNYEIFSKKKKTKKYEYCIFLTKISFFQKVLKILFFFLNY